MRRYNPFHASPVSSVSDTRDFTDPLHPDEPFTLCFTVDPGTSANDRRNELAGQLVEKWVTGDDEYVSSGHSRGTPPTPPQIITGQTAKIVKVSEETCLKIARFLDAETPPDSLAPLSDADWLTMSEVDPGAFQAIHIWWANLFGEARGVQGNAWRAPVDTISAMPSPTESAITHTSLSDEIPITVLSSGN